MGFTKCINHSPPHRSLNGIAKSPNCNAVGYYFALQTFEALKNLLILSFNLRTICFEKTCKNFHDLII